MHPGPGLLVYVQLLHWGLQTCHQGPCLLRPQVQALGMGSPPILMTIFTFLAPISSS